MPLTNYLAITSKRLLLFLLLGIAYTYLPAQNGTLANYEAVVEDIFYSDYQFAKMSIDSITTQLGRKNQRLYYVYFTSRGHRMRAEYDNRLIWRLTYVYLSYEDLPRPCQRYIKENYLDQGFSNLSIRYQDAPNDSYYKIDVVKGTEHFQLRFDNDGYYMKRRVR